MEAPGATKIIPTKAGMIFESERHRHEENSQRFACAAHCVVRFAEQVLWSDEVVEPRSPKSDDLTARHDTRDGPPTIRQKSKHGRGARKGERVHLTPRHDMRDGPPARERVHSNKTTLHAFRKSE